MNVNGPAAVHNYTRSTQSKFGGIINKPGAADGAICAMKNMTGDYYPLLATREPGWKREGKSTDILDIYAFDIFDGVSAWVGRSASGAVPALYYNSELVTGLPLGSTVTERQIVKLGNLICIWPDKFFYDIRAAAAKDYKTTVLTVVPAKEEVDGNVIIAIEPEELNVQHYIWLDDSWQVFSPAHYMEAFVHPGDANFTDGTYEGQPAERNTIKFSKSYTNSWTANWRLNVGDAVTISGAGNAENNKTAVIREIYTDDTYMYLRFYEGTFKNDNSDQSIMIKRAVPDLDFVFEHKNRIWGCKGREIFCCHLGSPLNWYEYDSLADGAWAVEIGKGNLTGGFAYNHPLFFTEDVVYTILGNAPEEYSLSATPSTFGCAKGSHRSFAVVRGYLFYHSPYGFCYYYGSMPYLCGDDLGEHYFKEAVGGGKGDKYYVSCLDENNAARTFVYDTRLGVWHEEENAWGQKVAGYAWDGDLYAAMGDGVYTVGIPRNKPSATSEFGAISMPSYVEFAPFYIDSLNKKQIKSILIRHEVKEKLTIKIYVDGEENISLRRVLKGNGVTEVVGIPRRGDQWSLVFEGSGKWRVYSIGYDYYEGSARK